MLLSITEGMVASQNRKALSSSGLTCIINPDPRALESHKILIKEERPTVSLSRTTSSSTSVRVDVLGLNVSVSHSANGVILARVSVDEWVLSTCLLPLLLGCRPFLAVACCYLMFTSATSFSKPRRLSLLTSPAALTFWLSSTWQQLKVLLWWELLNNVARSGPRGGDEFIENPEYRGFGTQLKSHTIGHLTFEAIALLLGGGGGPWSYLCQPLARERIRLFKIGSEVKYGVLFNAAPINVDGSSRC